MGLDCERNSLNVSELLQYNAHSIDEEDEISYENQNENLKTEDDENNQNEQRSDSLLTERKYFKENNSVQVKSENIVYLNSQINSIHLSSISFDYLNPSSYDNSSSDISRSPSPLKQSRMGGFSPEAKRKSSKGFLKISIPLRKQSLSNSGRKTYHDKYTTLEKIGQGSLGLVSRCRCMSTQKEYAVKTIGFKDGEHLLNISREFFLLQSLKHPNVVRTYDLFIENKKCYIILDYVVGFSLQDYLEKHQKMSGKDKSQLFQRLNCHSNQKKILKDQNICLCLQFNTLNILDQLVIFFALENIQHQSQEIPREFVNFFCLKISSLR